MYAYTHTHSGQSITSHHSELTHIFGERHLTHTCQSSTHPWYSEPNRYSYPEAQ